jgi:SAM-dependent methyltransferase
MDARRRRRFARIVLKRGAFYTNLPGRNRVRHCGCSPGRGIIPSVNSAPERDSRDRFSDRVEDYVRYRPSYPLAVIDFLTRSAGLGPEVTVADIGSGTGIFTALLLDTGARVFGIEPNAAMREAAQLALGGRPNFASLGGSAEETGLPGRVVTLATCAQAFHWFDVPRARREFMRILVPNGMAALVWNTAGRTDTPFAAGYERIKAGLAGDFHPVRHEAIGKAGRCDAFFGAGCWERRTFPNAQHLDLPGLRGRLLSSSYAPKEGGPGHAAMIGALDDLFRRTAAGGLVTMEYETEVYLGRFGASPAA